MAKVLNHDTDHRGFLDLNKKELRNVALQSLTVDITTPVDGLIFLRTDTSKVRVRIAGAWEDLATMDDVTAGGISVSTIDAKGDLLSGTAADAIAREAVGADGTFYVADSGQATGHTWRTIADADLPVAITRDTEVFLKSAYTTKGDIGVASAAGVVAREGVGANGTFYVADSAQSTGHIWRAITATDIDELLATNDLTDWPRTAALDLNSQKITGLADGTAVTDAATFGQLNAILEGKLAKDPVMVASTANLGLSGLAAIDGYTPVAGDRVLAKDQTTTSQNGLYVAAAGAWSRTADMSAAAEFKNATVLVLNGTTNQGRIYTESATVTTVGTDPVTFVQTGDATVIYTADGTTLTLTGTQFSITAGGVGVTQLAAAVAGNGLTGGGGSALAVNTGTGLEISADTVRIAAAAAGAGLTGGAGSALAVGQGSGIIVNADDVAVDGSIVVKAADGTLTGGATSEVLTHNLGTRLVKVAVRNSSSPWDEVEVENEATTTNTVTVRAAGNLPAGYTWLVMGIV